MSRLNLVFGEKAEQQIIWEEPKNSGDGRRDQKYSKSTSETHQKRIERLESLLEEYMIQILKLEDEIKEYKRKINELQSQRNTVRQSTKKSECLREKQEESRIENETIREPDITGILNIPQRREDVESRLEACSKLDLKVLRAIGLGYTTKSNISKFIGRNGTDLNQSLRRLTSRNIGFIKFVDVKTCYGPVSHYSLRDYGQAAYKIEFGEYPVVDQSIAISSEVQADHLYLQQEVLDYYEWKGFAPLKGYKYGKEPGLEAEIKINGKNYRIDVLMTKDDEIRNIEIETGKSKKRIEVNGIWENLHKNLVAYGQCYFVTPNERVSELVAQTITEYHYNHRELEFVCFVTSFKKLVETDYYTQFEAINGTLSESLFSEIE